MNIIQFYQDYNIPFQTEGHKHCRPGWVNTECPFCVGNPGLHLGIPIDGGFFYCWRCGPHPPSKVIAKLLHVKEAEAYQILKQYLGVNTAYQPKVKLRKRAFKLPSNTRPLLKRHRKYLIKRGFDPDYLIEKYKLLGTDIYSRLKITDKSIDYSRRIIAPIFWNNEQVSFQSRDITDRNNVKYLACPKEREIIHHKDIIYGIEDNWTDFGICVEGIFDVFRFGDLSFATLGIKYTNKQVRIISKKFKKVAICYDDDPQAFEQAKLLEADLKFRGVTAWVEKIKGDPGSMSLKEKDKFLNKILKK